MTRPWFATNARELLDARRQGMLPEGPVVVSMIGGTFPQTALYVRPDMPIERLDWSMLVNLEVWIWAGRTETIERVMAIVLAIAKAKPQRLYLRFEDSAGRVHDVDVGTGTHRNGLPEHGIQPEHSFTFCPVNSSGTYLGRKLTTALARMPIGDLA